MEIGNRCGTTDAIIAAECIMLKQKLRKEGSEKKVYLLTNDLKISSKELEVKKVEECV